MMNPGSLISRAFANKKFLLVLDNEGKKMMEEEIMSKLNGLLPLQEKGCYKVLITRANSNSSSTGSTRSVVEVPVKPLSMESHRL